MKKLILVLTIAFMFVAGSAFAATVDCIMYASENNGSLGTSAGNAGPTITSDYTFTIETSAGAITGWTNLFDGYFYASSYSTWAINTNTMVVTSSGYTTAGFDPRGSHPYQNFSPGQLVFAHDEAVSLAQIAFSGTAAWGTQHGLWFMGQANTSGPLAGQVFAVGLLATTWDGTDGVVYFGPNTMLQESYTIHINNVPIPAAAWLLLSGLVGIVALRKRS